MPSRFVHSPLGVFTLIVALLVVGLPTAQTRAFDANSTVPSAPASVTRVFLPLVQRAPGAPQIRIISPFAGTTLSGTSFFAVQALVPGSVNSVTFAAAGTSLGTDSTPDSGFQVFLDTATLPAGPAELVATASGPDGIRTEKVAVIIVASAPANASVGPNGTLVSTASGSTITVPPDTSGASFTIGVRDRTQDQVKQERGVDWDGMGVTFLGAIEMQTSASLEKPVSVSSVGFGNRIQPAQAVVTYGIQPDADGDGAGELVVVNGASRAPNGTIVSSPIPQLVVNQFSTRSSSGSLAPAQADDLVGPPGTQISLSGTGFNVASAQGNVAHFRSVAGAEATAPLLVRLNPSDALGGQHATTFIPILPAGPATMLLKNESTGAQAGPFAVTITAPPPLSRPASQTIDEALGAASANIQYYADALGQAGSSAYTQDAATAVRAIAKLRALLQPFAANPTPEQAQVLNQLAAQIEAIGIQQPPARLGVKDSLCNNISQVGSILGGVGALGAGLAGLGGTTLVAEFFVAGAATAMVAGGAFLFLAAAGLAIGVGVACWDYQAPPPVCAPAPNTGNKPASIAIAQAGSGGITGMGSAPAPGGAGCGNVVGGSDDDGVHRAEGRATMPEPGRYIVKIYPRKPGAKRPLTPFTGTTDPGGYFFVPLIPAGEPFTAVAIDTRTGERRTAEGVGPPIGQSTLLNFSFVSDGGPPPGYSMAIPRPATAGFGEFGEQLSLALDERDDPMVAYVWADVNNDGDGADTGLFFARWDRGERRWRQPIQVATLGTSYNPRGSDQVALARDPVAGTLGIAYTAGGIAAAQRVWLTRSADGGATWVAEQVSDNSHGASTHPGLALRNGATYVTYRTNGGVYYAVRALAAGPFSFAKAPSLPGLSSYSEAPVNLALDANAQPALVYGQSQANMASALAFWRPGQASATKIVESALAQPAQISASLAFFGTAPRVAFHMRLAGPPDDERQLWFSGSDDGASWGAPVRLRDGTATTFRTPSLAIDAQGQAAVGASVLSNTGGVCAGPKLARSRDLASWTVCSPDTFTIATGGGEHYLNVRFTSDNRLVIAFQFTGNAQLVPGVVIWREP